MVRGVEFLLAVTSIAAEHLKLRLQLIHQPRPWPRGYLPTTDLSE